LQQVPAIVIENITDPFAIPSYYTWVTAEEKMQEKNKSKKGKKIINN